MRVYSYTRYGHGSVLRDAKKIIRRLRQEGWRLSRVSGSHHILHHPGRQGIIIVPVHGGRELKPGTARAIAKAAGWID